MFTKRDAGRVEDEGRNFLAVVFDLPAPQVKVSAHANGNNIYVYAETDLGKDCIITWKTLDRLRAGFVSVFGVSDPPMRIETVHNVRGIRSLLKFELSVKERHLQWTK